MTPRLGDGYFQWNAGGWFGSQLGSTAYLLIMGLVVLFDSPRDGGPVLLCGLVPNLVGWILWRRRDRIRPYPALQALLLAVFLGVLAFWAFVAWLASPPVVARYFQDIEQAAWVLLLFPALMLQFRFLERRHRNASPAP